MLDLAIKINLAISLIVATIPIVPAGLFTKDFIEQRIFNVEHIAIANIIFAGILLFAYLKRKDIKNLYSVTLYSALFIMIFSQPCEIINLNTFY